MNKLILGAAVVALSACGVDGATSFRQGVPKKDAVKMKMPGQGTALTSSTGTRRDGLEGERAEFYALTRAVTLTVNGGTAGVLNLVEQITEYPPSTITQDSATWGPHTDALSPNTWKLVVTRSASAQNTYTYELSGKGKTEADSAYRVVLSGTHVDGGENFGTGTFLLDFTAASQLPEHDGNVGAATITYSRATSSSDTEINAEFVGIRDGAQTVDAQYHYVETPGQGGLLDYDFQKDFVAGPAIENATIRSRWQQSGAGRSDIRASGGDTTSDVTISECWDSGFLSRFLEASFASGPSYGTAAVCAFTTASFATL